MEIEKIYRLFLQSTDVCIDSRKVNPGSIFFALKGENSDGNEFVSSALEKGALCCITDNASYQLNNKCILVPDTLIALQQLAAKYRSGFQFPVLGITGSNGKTTTKELIACVLNKKYNTFATQGNLNNHIGVPLSILSVHRGCTFAVIEMGANHLHEIDFLCGIADPGFGLITNIGRAHLEGFGSPENIKKGKSELYQYVMHKNGVLFANSSESILDDVYKNYPKVVKYGFDPADFLRGELIHTDQFASVSIGDATVIHSHLTGSYNAHNILGAACVGKYFGISDADIKNAIENYFPYNNRSEWREINGNYFILDAYNANPSSMEAALYNFMELKSPDKIAVIGDMLELGDYAQDEHKRILGLAQKGNFKYLITVGPEFGRLKNENTHLHFDTAEQVREWMTQKNFSGYSILVKGSRKIGLEKIIS